MPKILIIEDNPVNLFLYREVLEKSGKYEVIMSTDGKNVPDIVKRDKPNLVLLDIQLPIKSGFDVYDEIKSKCAKLMCKIPVMFISAEMSSNEIAQKAGVASDRCIAKPIDFRQLLSKIESLCQTTQRKEFAYDK